MLDRPYFPEPGDGARLKTEISFENVLRLLSERWGGRTDTPRRVVQLDGNAERANRSGHRVIKRDDHGPRHDLRVREDFSDVAHRSTRDTGLRQHRDPVGRWAGTQTLDKNRPKRLAVFDAILICRKPRVVRQVVHTQNMAKHTPE